MASASTLSGWTATRPWLARSRRTERSNRVTEDAYTWVRVEPERADAGASAQVMETVASVGAALDRRLAEIGRDIHRTVTSSIPELGGDERVIAALTAGAEANVVTLVHLLQGAASIDDAQAPPAALTDARRLAQQGVSLVALLRAYRVGHARFLHWCLKELEATSAPGNVPGATAAIVDASLQYADRVTEQVALAYETERDRWSRNSGAARRARVRDLLMGEPVDLNTTERLFGYRLRQHHLGVVAWCERERSGRSLFNLEQAVVQLADHIGAPSPAPLFIPYDDTCAWAWLASPAEDITESLDGAIADFDPPIHVALGERAQGVDGFCRTHREALRAQSVAVAGGVRAPKVTRFREIAPIAALSTDLEFTRDWIHAMLRRLATPDAAHERLRETARIFLTSGGSYSTTAELLHIHKNTVQYRIQKAEELLGRSLREARIELELALLACHWMGETLLPARGAHSDLASPR